MAAIIERLEQMAAWGDCGVSTIWESMLALVYRGYAAQYAEFLSDCAKSFFGV